MALGSLGVIGGGGATRGGGHMFGENIGNVRPMTVNVTGQLGRDHAQRLPHTGMMPRIPYL